MLDYIDLQHIGIERSTHTDSPPTHPDQQPMHMHPLNDTISMFIHIRLCTPFKHDACEREQHISKHKEDMLGSGS